MIYTIYVDTIKNLIDALGIQLNKDLSSKETQIEISNLLFKASNDVSNVENKSLEHMLSGYSADFEWLGVYSNDTDKYRSKIVEAIQSLDSLIHPNVKSSLDLLK